MTDDEWLKEQIKRGRQMLAIRWQQIEKLKTRASFWHGKWAIVCAENNTLRKKLSEPGQLRKRFESWLVENVGERCEDFEPSCFVCQKWSQLDALFYGLED